VAQGVGPEFKHQYHKKKKKDKKREAYDDRITYNPYNLSYYAGTQTYTHEKTYTDASN
jgi:hypothetical protein